MQPYGVKRNWGDTDYAKVNKRAHRQPMRTTVKLLHRRERRVTRNFLKCRNLEVV